MDPSLGKECTEKCWKYKFWWVGKPQYIYNPVKFLDYQDCFDKCVRKKTQTKTSIKDSINS